VRMAELGVEAIHALATTGEAPEASEGLDFFNTGVELVTDQPHEGIESITSTEAGDVCWG
jgi:fructose transport system substrate-binding protein